MRVTYQDVRGKRKPVVRYGFIIEAEELVSERLKAHPFDISTMHPNNCDQVATTTLSVFQYMIGNTDWSVAEQHNIKLFVPKNISSEARTFAILYDFFYSGFVNAHYAEVSNILPIDYITQRYYLGYCCEEEILREVLESFRSKKELVFNLLQSATLLDEQERDEVTAYLNLFYDKLAKPNLIASELERQCK